MPFKLLHLVGLLLLLPFLAGCAAEEEKEPFNARSGLTPEARDAQDRRAALADGMEDKLDEAMEELEEPREDAEGEGEDPETP